MDLERPAIPRTQDEIVALYQRRIYAVIYRMTGTHAEADDLCQETFLQVFRGLPRLRADSDLDAWVYRVAMNISVDYLRRKTKDRTLAERLRAARAADEAAPAAADPELEDAVRAAIDQLPPEQKAVIVLRVFEGLEHEEIARIQGVPVATVRWRLFTARRKLEDLLAEHL